jgi:hypothetical protein
MVATMKIHQYFLEQYFHVGGARSPENNSILVYNLLRSGLLGREYPSFLLPL